MPLQSHGLVACFQKSASCWWQPWSILEYVLDTYRVLISRNYPLGFSRINKHLKTSKGQPTANLRIDFCKCLQPAVIPCRKLWISWTTPLWWWVKVMLPKLLNSSSYTYCVTPGFLHTTTNVDSWCFVLDRNTTMCFIKPSKSKSGV